MRAYLVRRPFLAAALVCVVLVSLSCGGDSGSPTPTPNSVLVSPGADTLISIGSHRTFTAQVLDANGDPIDGKTVTWSSSAPGVLSIDPVTGLATAVTNGPAVVHATSGTLQGSANVIVLQLVASVTVTPANASFTAVGDTQRFTAVAKDSGGTTVPGVQILWTTSDNSVATIDTLGLAKAKGAGTALVSAQGQARAGYAAIGVDPTVTQFAVIGAPTTGVAGDVAGTALQVELRDANGNRAMNSALAVTVAAAGAATGTPLHGATTVLADQGRATFANLWFEKAGIDRFKITVAALPVDSGSLVTVAPAAPAVVHLGAVAQFQHAGVPLGLVVSATDRFGNPATNYAGPIQALSLAGPGLGPLFGDSIVDAVVGVATFPDLTYHFVAVGHRLTATIPGLQVQRDTSAQFVVEAGVPGSFALGHHGVLPTPGTFGNDSTVVQVTDSFGNLVLADSFAVHARVVAWPYSAPAGYASRIEYDSVEAVVGGEAAFHFGLTRPGRFRFVFTAPGFAADTSEELIPTLPHSDYMAASGDVMCLTHTFCSGDNTAGELGVDPGTLALDSLFIVRDSFLPASGAAFFDGGAHHFCAMMPQFPDGYQVGCWGDNTDGQLGDGTVGGTKPFGVLAGAALAAAGELSAGGNHTCAVMDGVAKCWGRNTDGELGTGSAGASTGTPSTVTGGYQFLKLAAGGRHTCGITDLHALVCWGANDYGQLGDSGVSGTSSATPVAVWGGASWVDVTAGDDFTCAANDFSQLYCWGRNDTHQLGPNVSGAAATIPRLAMTAPDYQYGSLVAGGAFTCATFHDLDFGIWSTKCWGANDHGQLGRGSVSPSDSVPTNVLGNTLVGIVAGKDFACGNEYADPFHLYCWGRNDHGQFGGGTTKDFNIPTEIQGSY